MIAIHTIHTYIYIYWSTCVHVYTNTNTHTLYIYIYTYYLDMYVCGIVNHQLNFFTPSLFVQETSGAVIARSSSEMYISGRSSWAGKGCQSLSIWFMWEICQYWDLGVERIGFGKPNCVYIYIFLGGPTLEKMYIYTYEHIYIYIYTELSLYRS